MRRDWLREPLSRPLPPPGGAGVGWVGGYKAAEGGRRRALFSVGCFFLQPGSGRVWVSVPRGAGQPAAEAPRAAYRGGGDVLD